MTIKLINRSNGHAVMPGDFIEDFRGNMWKFKAVYRRKIIVDVGPDELEGQFDPIVFPDFELGR